MAATDFIARQLISSGARDAVTTIGAGAAVGAVAIGAYNGVNGDSVLSGAFGGALLGAGAGAGLREAGRRYIQGAMRSGEEGLEGKFKTSLFTNASKEDDSLVRGSFLDPSDDEKAFAKEWMTQNPAGAKSGVGSTPVHNDTTPDGASSAGTSRAAHRDTGNTHTDNDYEQAYLDNFHVLEETKKAKDAQKQANKEARAKKGDALFARLKARYDHLRGDTETRDALLKRRKDYGDLVSRLSQEAEGTRSRAARDLLKTHLKQEQDKNMLQRAQDRINLRNTLNSFATRVRRAEGIKNYSNEVNKDNSLINDYIAKNSSLPEVNHTSIVTPETKNTYRRKPKTNVELGEKIHSTRDSRVPRKYEENAISRAISLDSHPNYKYPTIYPDDESFMTGRLLQNSTHNQRFLEQWRKNKSSNNTSSIIL